MKLKNLFLILMLTLFLVSCSNEKIEDKEVNIAELSDSVFKLSVADENGNLIAEGSGFCIYDSKTLITNYHVIEDGYSITATSQNEIIYNIAGVYHYDEDRDIAILKLENRAKCPVLPIAKDYKVGEEVYAIGSPLGLKNTISNGLISAERENGEYIDLQISVPISSGSSGGALLNTKGEVVGVTYAGMIDGQNLNFAIPMIYFNNIELDDSKIKTLSNIIEENTPGNLLVNYSFGTNPYILDFNYNGDSFVAYICQDWLGDENGIVIKSSKLGFEKKINGTYYSPNYYKGKLYFIDSEKQILSIDLKDLLSSNYELKNVLDVSGYSAYSIYSIFVCDDRILTKTQTNSIIISDLNGNILSNYEDTGISSAIFVDSNIIGYTYGDNGIKTLNLDTFETNIISTNISFKYVTGYQDGKFFLSKTDGNGFEYIYDIYNSSVETFDADDVYALSCFNDYIYIHEQPRGGPGFRGQGIVNKHKDSIYTFQLTTGIKFTVPLEIWSATNFNYGTNNKMYVTAYNEKDEICIYRMNLDCTEIEEIGVYLIQNYE